jgi:hypothetical protein
MGYTVGESGACPLLLMPVNFAYASPAPARSDRSDRRNNPFREGQVCHHALDANAKLCKISEGGLQESDRTAFALIGQDLHEREPRSIVDADTDELPADAVVAVDRARISPGNAEPIRPSFLISRWMSSLALITANRLDRLQGAVQSEPKEWGETRSLLTGNLEAPARAGTKIQTTHNSTSVGLCILN